MPEFQYILVGGGLQSALLVLALRSRNPGASIALVEREARLGGNHTWCFHGSDLSPEATRWIEPLVTKRWDGYEVRFPGLQRELDDPYAAIESSRVDEVIGNALSTPRDILIRGSEVTEIGTHHVRLADGRQLRGTLVVDARGPEPAPPRDAGFQKFLGHELRFSAPHGLLRPILMDAEVDQTEGFRFFYVLPLEPDRLLVEDTRFSESRDLDAPAMREAITSYCLARGWTPTEILREETGVLPMPWKGQTPTPTRGPLQAGYRGGWFHPATGYSLPVAARLAETVACLAPDEVFQGGLRALQHEQQRQRNYCHLLNRMLFRWYPPRMRWHIFARFYRLPLARISRFYALRLNNTDRVRLLVGRPPRGLSLRYRLQSGVPS